MGGTLHVAREDHVLDRLWRWDIVIDGKVVGAVANGMTCDLPVRSGKHEVRVGHRWWSSPVRRFQVRHGGEIELVCRPRPHPLVWIPYGVASLVRQGLFISLEPPNSSPTQHRTRLRAADPTCI